MSHPAKVHLEMNYFRTLIAVADDCPVESSVVPPDRGATKTIAVLQYEMLASRPSVHTQEDVLFHSWFQRQHLPEKSSSAAAKLRKAFFSKPQPCLRSSPLPKRYGWGLLFDEEGRVALCAMESKEYAQLVVGGSVTVLKALRSRRA